MLKIVFHFFVLGVTVLVAANSSQAASFEYLYGQLRPTTEVVPASAAEPLAWADESDDQVALASFFDRISGGGKDDGGKDGDSKGDGKGKGCGDECVGNWRDNTEVWIGADVYKSLGDQSPFGAPSPFSVGNSFGGVTGFNTGFALGDLRMRGQIGASYGAYDFKGRTTAPPNNDDSLEQQGYLTFGLYKRSNVCCDERLSWGVVYDQFFGHQWGWLANEVYLSQIRAIAGYAINESNELGVWGTFHTNQDLAALTTIPTTPVRAMNQANAYWRHNWAFGGNSMMYIGAFDQADVASWQLGMINTAPLSHSVSLYGNFNYVVPGSATGLVGAAEEQWNASVGLVYYLGAKAVSSTVSGNQGLALLPVANNGSLLITH